MLEIVSDMVYVGPRDLPLPDLEDLPYTAVSVSANPAALRVDTSM